MSVGQTGEISGFQESDQTVENLLQMGLTEGSAIEILRLAPSGDPIELRVSGYSLSMRKADAELVIVTI
ncbi:MAG: ferrous iron transport protein A [Proteobacteria bacterium]|jgi:ferrous iron transport protein A|nr:ferrous iron transport protein A [Pseudomonadota bacterium]MBT6465222.1 ferrous iron transport protein A [Pseudomonadota bacterium]MBT6675230.1 ferrous iron transport protein A [Pseudomonadota bacterium]MBT7562705.1 ferrous iron transport protein A [Pseudomonadota bacterium]MBT7626430.1 ferrous iron transport protein A [Pseudomonadota bacterium]